MTDAESTPHDTALIVVSYGSANMVEQSLSHMTIGPNVLVVIVDNYSSDTERTSAREITAQHGWTLVEPETNLGFGGGCNVGVARARESGATRIILLNPDAYLEGDGLADLSTRVAEAPDTLFSPLVVYPNGHHFASLMELDRDEGHLRRAIEGRRYPRTTEWLSGACLALSVELWDRAGGFDDDYFLYWEDVGLSRQVLEAGGTLAFVTEIRAVHSAGGTQQGGAGSGKSAIYYFYNTRNRMVYAAKHEDTATQKRWARGAVREAMSVLSRGGRRQFLRPDKTLWPALRGTLSGLRFARARRGRGHRHSEAVSR